MNYGKNEVEKTLRKTNSRSQKITSHLVLLLTKIILILVLFAAVLGISFGYGIFKGVIDAAPEIDVASIEPSGYATMVYDSKGNLTETLVKSGANRLEASYEELPQCLIELSSRLRIPGSGPTKALMSVPWSVRPSESLPVTPVPAAEVPDPAAH